MKILLAADSHIFREDENIGYFKAFAEYAKQSHPGAVMVAGDIIEYPGISPLDTQEYNNSLNLMLLVAASELDRRKKHKKIELTPYERFCILPILAEEILRKPFPGDMKAIARQYMGIIRKAEWQMKTAYQIAEHILGKSLKEILVLGGNHDSNLEETVLKPNNLHKKSRIIKCVSISGYGGAAASDGFPLVKGCPPELTTPFNEYPKREMNKHGILEERIVSEPREFLEKEQPDIALLHTPPFGIMDKPHKLDDVEMPEEQKHFGSKGILEYAKTGKTKLFLFGHVHDRQGVERIKSDNGELVVAVNPGSLGKTDVEGGSFAEIEVDETTKDFLSAKMYRILPGGMIAPERLFIRRNRAVIDEIYLRGQMPNGN